MHGSSQQGHKQFISKLLPLVVRVNGRGQVAHDMSKDLQAAGVRMNFTSQTSSIGSVSHQGYSGREAAREEVLHILIGNFEGLPGKAATLLSYGAVESLNGGRISGYGSTNK
jgi:hypothetical protein